MPVTDAGRTHTGRLQRFPKAKRFFHSVGFCCPGELRHPLHPYISLEMRGGCARDSNPTSGQEGRRSICVRKVLVFLTLCILTILRQRYRKSESGRTWSDEDADRCRAIASATACSHCALVRGSHDTWRATCELICNSQNRSVSDSTCSRSRTGHEFIQVPEAARRSSRKESYAVTESSRPGQQMRTRRNPRWQRALRESGVQLLPPRMGALRGEPGYLASCCHFGPGPTLNRARPPSAHKRSRVTPVFVRSCIRVAARILLGFVLVRVPVRVIPAWRKAIKPD